MGALWLVWLWGNHSLYYYGSTMTGTVATGRGASKKKVPFPINKWKGMNIGGHSFYSQSNTWVWLQGCTCLIFGKCHIRMGLLSDYIRQYHLTCSWGWFIKLVVCTTECPCSVCLLSGSPSGHYKCYHLLDALCGMSVSNFFTFFFLRQVGWPVLIYRYAPLVYVRGAHIFTMVLFFHSHWSIPTRMVVPQR